jgi:hypothetical protein
MTPARKGYPVKHIRFLTLWLPPLVIIVVAFNILRGIDQRAARQAAATPFSGQARVTWVPDRWEWCNTVDCLLLDQEEELQQAEDAARILTPGNPLQWVSDLQNLQAIAFECAGRSSPREGNEVDFPGGAGKGVSTTMPSAAWRPQVPGPSGEEWIKWACSVTKPNRMWEAINGHLPLA